MEASALITRSIQGTKTGLAFNISLKDRWQLGYFNLRSYQLEQGAETYEGLMIQRFFKVGNKLLIGPALRVGYMNKDFLTVLPSLQAAYKLNNKIRLGAGIARSDGFSHFNLHLGFKIFSKY